MWIDEERKLEKSGRKWTESESIPYRFAHLYCEKCGKELGCFDIVTTNPETNMYCSDCVAEYINPHIPVELPCGFIVKDYGGSVDLKYAGGYYEELTVNKVCYFNKKGRYIKVKGKRYYV